MAKHKKFGPMLGWISLSSLDAVGRIALKVVSTVMFARWLTPEIFGQSSLTIVVVAMLSIFVSAPFEEALTRQKIAGSRHFGSAMTVVLCLSAGICMLAMAVAWVMRFQAGDSSLIAGLVAMFSLILFAQGPISIYTALARRQRAFKRLALSNVGGELVGTIAGLALAFSGVGVWSLLAVRLVGRYTTLAWLMIGSPAHARPRFSKAHLSDLSTFAGWFFGARLLAAVSDVAFQTLVTRLFGLTGTGYLNMAVRIIDPVRGLVGSMGHNISVSFFIRVQDAPAKLRAVIEQTLTSTSLFLLPLFIGLAASGPTIVSVLAGPEWDESGRIVVCLALGAAILAPTNFLRGAIGAKGRAELVFFSGLVECLLVIGALLALSSWGLIAIGLARLLSFCGQAVFNTAAARAVLAFGAGRTLAVVGPAMLSAGAMGGAVAAIGTLPALEEHALARLGIQIATGIMVYSLLVALFHRAGLRMIYQSLRASPGQ